MIDVSEAEFIDSSVLHTLVAAHRHADATSRRVVLQLGTAPVVGRAPEISGLLDSLECATSLGEALASGHHGKDRWADEPWRKPA